MGRADRIMGMGKGQRNARTRKSILAWMLVFGLFVFAGCGGQNDSNENAAPENPTDMENNTVVDSETDIVVDSEKDIAADSEKAEASTEEDVEGSDEKDVEGARREGEETADETAAKKLSILGDSISTFEGWIPEGYSCYFPMSGEVMNVEQTWWSMVLEDTEMELCVNGSSAGSTCVGDSSSSDAVQYGCSECRIWDLIGSKGAFPDVIIVYMGTNDVLKSVPLGDNDGTQAVEEGMIENFSDAYCMMLDKLIAYYPNAEIYCCNLPQIGDWGPPSGPLFVPFVNGQELTAEDYGKRIEMIAAAKGCKLIDFQNCGITIENLGDYVTDGVHMNPEGMELLRKAVEAAL